jgi:hypothetical protein
MATLCTERALQVLHPLRLQGGIVNHTEQTLLGDGFMLDLLFGGEDGNNMFLRNVG